jgi:iron complex transport system ATP-binding protein
MSAREERTTASPGGATGGTAARTGLQAREVSWGAGGRTIVDRVSLDVVPGGTLGLLGPNGSGKSSLLRLLAGVRRPASGAVLLDGVDLRTLRRRDVARRVAVVEQHATTEVDLRVRDVVALGRTPHRAVWGAERPGDRDAVALALERTGLVGAEDRSWHTLSGGERQRVHVARALAQEPRELLLDEPTNHLDVHHQLELLALVRRLPVTTVVALHDLNLAAMFCDRLVVLAGGRVVADGPPGEVLTAALIADVYRVRAVVTPDGPGGVPAVRFAPGPVGTP